MKANEFITALSQLDQLAQDEYGQSLFEVANYSGDDEVMRLMRLGRLVGIVLKEPFATATSNDPTLSVTRAYRRWEPKPASEFENPAVRDSWQYRALDILRTDPEIFPSVERPFNSVFELAKNAQSERGFFGYLAIACHKYLCKKTVVDDINRNIEKARRAGFDIANPTPDMLIASGALEIGKVLVESAPILESMGPQIVAGLIYILIKIGTEEFCKWASQLDMRNAQNEK